MMLPQASWRPITKISSSRIFYAYTSLPLSRRAFSYASAAAANPQSFTYYYAPSSSNLGTDKDTTLADLKRIINQSQSSSKLLENTHRHDAAVVLATPEFSKHLCDPGFLGALARFLAVSEPRFNLLCAIVDKIPPKASRKHHQGISILRSLKDDLLPHIWDSDHNSLRDTRKETAETVSALAFELPSDSENGDSKTTIHLPLARTVFQNSKLSTLLAAQFDLSTATPRLLQTSERQTYRVNLPVKHATPWIPLLPLTPSRKVTESFGNIVRGVLINDQTIPASTELEDAINSLWEPSPDANPTPSIVYALVNPESAASPDGKPPQPDLTVQRGTATIESATQKTAQSSQYVQKVWRSGGNLHRVLSGGGGWGKKKGLLSLDPQTSHFPPSEDEAMDLWFHQGVASSSAPVGSAIQFFSMYPTAPVDAAAADSPDFVLGTYGGFDAALEEQPVDQALLSGQFGALSDQAIYVELDRSSRPPLKLSVPGSRLFLNR